MKHICLLSLLLFAAIFGARGDDKVGADAKEPGSSMPMQLRKLNLTDVLRLYGQVTHRTVLCKDDPNISFSLNTIDTNKAEAEGILTNLLKQEGFTIIPDGDKFVKIIKDKELKADLALSLWIKFPHTDAGLDKTNAPEAMIQAGEIDLPRVDLLQILPIYSDLTDAKGVEKDDEYLHLPPITVTLVTQNPLNKKEAIYAFDTLFSWNGFKLVPSTNGNIKVIRLK